MYMNLFAISADTGKLDPDQLQNMTEADAEVIINNLAESAAAQDGGQSPELQAKIDDALAQIDSQDGATKKEKLSQFLAQQ